MVGISNDDVIEDFDLEKLASADEISGDFDVRFGRSWLTPLGWLCMATIAAALVTMANLKTSRLTEQVFQLTSEVVRAQVRQFFDLHGLNCSTELSTFGKCCYFRQRPDIK